MRFRETEPELRCGRARCWHLIFPGKARACGPGPCWQPQAGMNNGRAGTGLPATSTVLGGCGEEPQGIRSVRWHGGSRGPEELGAGLTLLRESRRLCLRVRSHKLCVLGQDSQPLRALISSPVAFPPTPLGWFWGSIESLQSAWHTVGAWQQQLWKKVLRGGTAADVHHGRATEWWCATRPASGRRWDLVPSWETGGIIPWSPPKLVGLQF